MRKHFCCVLGRCLVIAAPLMAAVPDRGQDYYTTLRNELAAKGLPAGELLFGTTETAVLGKFVLGGGGTATGDQMSPVC